MIYEHDGIDRLIQPDQIMPSQYFGALRAANVSPEHNIVVSLLEVTLRDLQAGEGEAQRLKTRGHIQDITKIDRLYRAAREWVDDEGVRLCSFDWVCEYLAIEPGWLRGRLTDWAQNGTKLKRRSAAEGALP